MKLRKGSGGSGRSLWDMMANGEDEKVPFMGREIKVEKKNLMTIHDLWSWVPCFRRGGNRGVEL